MNNGIKRALAEKVKDQAETCHELYKTSSITCEPQYIDFYIHALDYYGCVIMENSFNDYIFFIVDRPELLNGSIDECIASYDNKEVVVSIPSKKAYDLSWIYYVVVFLLGGLLGGLLGYII